MRLIIAEKPMISQLLCKSGAILKKWPNEDIFLIHTYSFAGFKFKYPSDLKYSDFPLVGNPEYKISLHMEMFPAQKDAMTKGFYVRDLDSYKESKHLTVSQVREVIQKADHIVFAGDADATGMFAFHLYLRMFAPDRLEEEHDALHIDGGLHEEAINTYFTKSITTYDPRIINLLERGKVKKYFEYNFNLNAMAILNKPFQVAFGRDKTLQMSKYELQTLHFLAMSPNQRQCNVKLTLAMDHWIGTGKYNRKDSWNWEAAIGSPASRQSILRNLVDIGAFESIKHEPNGQLAVTDAGRAFLKSLHPDTKDLDLPFRIDQWQTEGLEIAKPKIDRYIRTFFGKQKRFNEKQ